MPTIKEAIEHLKSYSPDEHCAMHLWTEPDVIGTAEEGGTPVTKKEAQQILDHMHDHIDSEYGVTWETIRCGIQELKGE